MPAVWLKLLSICRECAAWQDKTCTTSDDSALCPGHAGYLNRWGSATPIQTLSGLSAIPSDRTFASGARTPVCPPSTPSFGIANRASRPTAPGGSGSDGYLLANEMRCAMHLRDTYLKRAARNLRLIDEMLRSRQSGSTVTWPSSWALTVKLRGGRLPWPPKDIPGCRRWGSPCASPVVLVESTMYMGEEGDKTQPPLSFYLWISLHV